MPKYLGVGTKNGSVSYDLYYCISLSEYCWVKYGIHKVLQHYYWNPDPSVILISECGCLPIVEDEASLPCMQNPLTYLNMTHMNPVHTFITNISTITCNHLFLLLCWNILILNLKSCKDHCWQYRALNRILSMSRSQKRSLFSPPTEISYAFPTPLQCYTDLIWWRRITINYAIPST